MHARVRLAQQHDLLVQNAEELAQEQVLREILAIILAMINREGLIWLINITYQCLLIIRI